MKRLLKALIAAALWFAPAASHGAVPDSALEVPAEFQEAAKALRNRDFDAALSAAEAGLRNPAVSADYKTSLRSFRATALEGKGDIEAALAELDIAAMEAPGDARPFTARGGLLRREGKYEGALKAYAQAVTREENVGAAIVANLEYGWLLATGPVDELRDGVRAVDRATRAADLIKENSKTVAAHIYSPRVFDVLAAGLAEKGDFQSAAAMATIAADMAKVVGDTAFVNPGLAERLAAYEAGKPWRQPVK